MRSFVYTAHPARVLFGAGTLAELPAEVERLGRARALVLTTPELAEPAARATSLLGPLAAGVFDGVTMHTPVEITERAMNQLPSWAPTASSRSAEARPPGWARPWRPAPGYRRSPCRPRTPAPR